MPHLTCKYLNVIVQAFQIFLFGRRTILSQSFTTNFYESELLNVHILFIKPNHMYSEKKLRRNEYNQKLPKCLRSGSKNRYHIQSGAIPTIYCMTSQCLIPHPFPKFLNRGKLEKNTH